MSFLVLNKMAIEVAPPPPSGLTAMATGTFSIDTAWTLADNTDRGVRLQHSTDGGTTWPFSVDLPKGTIAYTDGGLNAGTTYTYRVFALGRNVASKPSVTATATTSSPSTLALDFSLAVNSQYIEFDDWMW